MKSYIDQSRYRMILNPKHPNANSRGYVSEHKIVFSKKLNRPIKPNEVIMHINGNPLDNRIENLRLYPNRETANFAKNLKDNHEIILRSDGNTYTRMVHEIFGINKYKIVE